MITVDWLACLAGLLGAALLACNNRYSKWGWMAFLLSNICWIAYSVAQNDYALLTQQAGFTVTSLIGVYKWLVAPSICNNSIQEV